MHTKREKRRVGNKISTSPYWPKWKVQPIDRKEMKLDFLYNIMEKEASVILKMIVNVEGRIQTKDSPELQWLLKNKMVKMERMCYGWNKNKCSYLTITKKGVDFYYKYS